MKVEVTVCNVCQAVGKPTEEYTVQHGRRSRTVDLCRDDAMCANLLELLSGGRKPRVTPMLTMEEIEERKRARRPKED